jgi:hypothetical protein
MTSIIKVDEIQNSAGTTTLAKVDNGVLTGALSPATGFRNRIINGDMRIDQRNAGAAVTITAANQYTLDRWQAFQTASSKFSIQQNAGSVTPPVEFTNYLGATSLSAYSVTSSDIFAVVQRVEGFNMADFGWGTANAKTATLSFWVRSSLTGTFGGSIVNNAANRSYPFTYSISAANTWEYKSVSIEGDSSGTWLTNNGTGANIVFGIGGGSTFSGTAGAWAGSAFYTATGATSVVGTSGATFYLTGVSLEKGTVATPFEFRSIGQELALCQRYFTVLSDISWVFWAGSNNTYQTSFALPAVMRASPTTVVLNAGTAQGGGGTVSFAASSNTAKVQVATGSTTQQRYGTAGASGSFSSEL